MGLFDRIEASFLYWRTGRNPRVRDAADRAISAVRARNNAQADRDEYMDLFPGEELPRELSERLVQTEGRAKKTKRDFDYIDDLY